MNLVQINERLKDLPMQVIQQYANGMNPEVPPYLALGELQRRELAQKQMATAQGAAQGPQPSIKEQVEQKAGLMAAQALQQQQMQQQMAQPSGPMPAPEGIPQPEGQPEAMASGGLASVPVRPDMFEYAGGGIIAFSGEDGSEVKSKYETKYDRMNRINREKEEAEKEARLEEIRAAGNETMPYGEQMRNVGRAIDRAVPDPIELLKTLISAPGYGLSKDKKPEDRPRQVVQTGSPDIPSSPGAPRSRPTAAPAAGPVAGPVATRPPRPAAPVAEQAGLPAALAGAPEFSATPVSPDRAELEALMKSQRRAAPTAEGIKSEVSALMPAGMQEEAMQKRFADQRARAEARQAAFDKSQPTGLEDLIRVFGQAGQYKGLSGIAPAYTALQQQRRAEQTAMRNQQDELMTAIEGREYGADKDVFTARTGAMDKAQTLFGQSEKSIIEAAAKKYEVEQGRIDADNRNKMQLDLKKFELAEEGRFKRMDLEQRERERRTTAANSGASQAAEYVNLKAQARAEAAKGNTAAAAEMNARADDMLAAKGGTGTANVGADNAQTRKLRDAVKDIDSRLETMDPKSAESKVLQSQRDRLSKLIVERAIGEAGGGTGAGGGNAPKIGDVQQGYRFKGGNPADQSNWEKVK